MSPTRKSSTSPKSKLLGAKKSRWSTFDAMRPALGVVPSDERPDRAELVLVFLAIAGIPKPWRIPQTIRDLGLEPELAQFLDAAEWAHDLATAHATGHGKAARASKQRLETHPEPRRRMLFVHSLAHASQLYRSGNQRDAIVYLQRVTPDIDTAFRKLDWTLVETQLRRLASPPPQGKRATPLIGAAGVAKHLSVSCNAFGDDEPLVREQRYPTKLARAAARFKDAATELARGKKRNR